MAEKIKNTPSSSMTEYLNHLAHCSDLEECWRQLCADLENFGFDRAIYARKANANRTNFFQLWDTQILSTYGPEADEYIIQKRGFSADITVQWALENEGPMSWGILHEKYSAGAMGEAEIRWHLRTRALGLTAGITFGLPIRENGARSGYGLCFGRNEAQDAADIAWSAAETEIVPRLHAFDIAASRYKYIPERERLTSRETAVLKLAANGKTIAEIAQLLSLHRRTVDDAMTRSRAKLNVATTLQAVLKADQQGQL